MTIGSRRLPAELAPQELIRQIVAAVRMGDDGRIRDLLALLSVRADVPMLFALRDALARECGSDQVVASLPRAGRG